MSNRKLQHQKNHHRTKSVKKSTEARKTSEGLHRNPIRFLVTDTVDPSNTRVTQQEMLFLQRTVGNQAVGRFIQTKWRRQSKIK